MILEEQIANSVNKQLNNQTLTNLEGFNIFMQPLFRLHEIRFFINPEGLLICLHKVGMRWILSLFFDVFLPELNDLNWITFIPKLSQYNYAKNLALKI